jgi:hypothetical protein
MSLTHGADGGPDLELLLRSELGDVADAVGSTAGPVPLRAVVERYRTARRRRRAKVAGAALCAVLAAVVVVSSSVPATRTEDDGPVTRPTTPQPRPSVRSSTVSSDPEVRAVVARLAELPTSPDSPMTSPESDGAERVFSPDGSRYAIHRQFGEPSAADVRYELQIRRAADDSLVAKIVGGESTAPIGWVGDHVVVGEPGANGGQLPFVWKPGDRDYTRVGGIPNGEEMLQIHGNRLLLVRFSGSKRCEAPLLDARVVTLRAERVYRLWEGCTQWNMVPMSPDGRAVVNAKSLFGAIDPKTQVYRGENAPDGPSTTTWDVAVTFTWAPDSRSYEVRFPLVVAGGDTFGTTIRCTLSDGRCVRLTGAP